MTDVAARRGGLKGRLNGRAAYVVGTLLNLALGYLAVFPTTMAVAIVYVGLNLGYKGDAPVLTMLTAMMLAVVVGVFAAVNGLLTWGSCVARRRYWQVAVVAVLAPSVLVWLWSTPWWWYGDRGIWVEPSWIDWRGWGGGTSSL